MLGLVLIRCSKKPLEIPGRGGGGHKEMCVFVLKVRAGRKDTWRTAETGTTVLPPYLKLWCNVECPWPPWNPWELLDALHSSFIDP